MKAKRVCYSDYHVHSLFSNDSSSKIEDICIAAKKKGMKSVCITDHIDAVNFQKMNDTKEIELFFTEFEKARLKYEGEIRVIPGFEFSEPYENIKLFENVLKYPFEYKMCSVHHCSRGRFPSPDSMEAKIAVHEYLVNVKKMLAMDGFDAIGHIDLIRRYFGEFPYSVEEIKEVLGIIIKKGLWLEINTSSMPKSVCDVHTKIDYVEEYVKMGGKKIVLGSDAHRIEDIGMKFEDISLKNVIVRE